MKKILVATIALSVLASAGVANAQSYSRGDNSRYEQSRGNDNDRRGEVRRDDGRRDNDRRGEARRGDDRRENVRGYENRYEQRASRQYRGSRYQAPRGYQVRQFHRGDRLPAAYRGRGYVMDHRAYGLGAPPRGYQYVRVGNDAVLTAVATGLIASVVLQLFQ